jgi:hypothetical protein
MQVVGTVGFIRHALLAGDLLHALADQAFGLGMQHKRHAECRGGTLACVVIRSGADASRRKDDVGACKGSAQRCLDADRIVAHILGPGQRKSSFCEQFDYASEVFVLTFSGEDFIADDDEAEMWVR